MKEVEEFTKCVSRPLSAQMIESLKHACVKAYGAQGGPQLVALVGTIPELVYTIEKAVDVIRFYSRGELQNDAGMFVNGKPDGYRQMVHQIFGKKAREFLKAMEGE